MNDNIAIRLKDLKKSYGAKEVLKGINLDVEKGQIVGYIGPNGAGKSTTVKLMLGLINEYDGNIEILGQDILNSGIEYKSKIGYVPETADIYESLTAREYLNFIGELYGINEKVIENKSLQLMKILY